MCEKSGRKEGRRPVSTKASVRAGKIRRELRSLDLYKPEFETSIKRLADLKVEYDELHERYAAAHYPCVIDGSSGPKKNPLVTTLESLRRDILALETALGLNPTGLSKLQENAFAKKRESKVASLTA